MTPEQKAYIKAMKEWGKDCAEWQLRNPTKDLVTELAAVHTDTGGDSPPLPPPHP